VFYRYILASFNRIALSRVTQTAHPVFQN